MNDMNTGLVYELYDGEDLEKQITDGVWNQTEEEYQKSLEKLAGQIGD